jgi:hypothetical protein
MQKTVDEIKGGGRSSLSKCPSARGQDDVLSPKQIQGYARAGRPDRGVGCLIRALCLGDRHCTRDVTQMEITRHLM